MDVDASVHIALCEPTAQLSDHIRRYICERFVSRVSKEGKSSAVVHSLSSRRQKHITFLSLGKFDIFPYTNSAACSVKYFSLSWASLGCFQGLHTARMQELSPIFGSRRCGVWIFRTAHDYNMQCVCIRQGPVTTVHATWWLIIETKQLSSICISLVSTPWWCYYGDASLKPASQFLSLGFWPKTCRPLALMPVDCWRCMMLCSDVQV